MPIRHALGVLLLAIAPAILAGCTSEPYLDGKGVEARTLPDAPAPQAGEGGDENAVADNQPRQADKVIVEKGQRRLHLVDNGEVFRSFRVALGSEPRGAKRREGDGRTPEGSYLLDWRNPESKFYRSIHVSYPGPEDRDRARRNGVDPGNNIMIHGLPDEYAWMGRSHVATDWTEGCIAVTNEEMDVIWESVPPDTPIEIRP